jgi:metal-responsive CopG/Arc/MetJ family transcriptional regulator
MFGTKVKIEKALYDRVKAVADKAGYSSADEFITNVLEKELAKLEDVKTDEQLEERLRGLGYIE